jgi:hypothetical protein
MKKSTTYKKINFQADADIILNPSQFQSVAIPWRYNKQQLMQRI